MKKIQYFLLLCAVAVSGCTEDPENDAKLNIPSAKLYYDEQFTEPYVGGENLLFYAETAKSLYFDSRNIKDVEFDIPKGWSAVRESSKITITAPAEVTVNNNQVIGITALFAGNMSISQEVGVSLMAQSNAVKAWQEFMINSDDNVLVDFSYAGYMHGEVGPPDVSTLGLETFNIEDYGGNGTDDVSDRAAFIAAYEAMEAKGGGILFIPEGRFILHDDSDNYFDNELGKMQSSSIAIEMDNFILKGESREKSVIVMKTPNLPKDENIMYSSPTMIVVGHNSAPNLPTAVTEDSAKGSHSVTVASAANFKVGDWVYLKLFNNSPELIAEELHPFSAESTMTNLLNVGVQVEDMHQITKISGSVITFKAPLMRAVDAKWGWELYKLRHYTNIGIEDLTFEGDCKENFKHHGSWQDDGAYKLIDFKRVTNSWMRRLTYRSVSEATSITMSANVSVYDIHITGKRGHSAIRSQRSSRVFIGKVLEDSNGTLVDGGGEADCAGQYHACGVAKPSMGTVLWNVNWGCDGCFESHATQPRATLIDNCKGALLNSRAGGAMDQLPNHLDDLTLWNFEATQTNYDNSPLIWWASAPGWKKILPPTVIGLHGKTVMFDTTQSVMKRNESQGTKVYPESLYQAQLELRLGFVPTWLQELN